MPKARTLELSTKPPAFFIHVSRLMPKYKFDTIIDVGANIGQSCVAFASHLPSARIISVEPVPETFATLNENVKHLPQIETHNVGLADTVGELRMAADGTSAGNRIVDDSTESGASGATGGSIAVNVTTGVELCRAAGVKEISFLKIDAEGYDLKVLHGFGTMLDVVDFVQVEVGMNPYNKLHVPYAEVDDYLRSFKFELFYIYGQTFEFTGGKRPIVRRANPVFINSRLIDMTGL